MLVAHPTPTDRATWRRYHSLRSAWRRTADIDRGHAGVRCLSLSFYIYALVRVRVRTYSPAWHAMASSQRMSWTDGSRATTGLLVDRLKSIVQLVGYCPVSCLAAPADWSRVFSILIQANWYCFARVASDVIHRPCDW